MKKIFIASIMAAGLFAGSGTVSAQSVAALNGPLTITDKTVVRFDRLPRNVQRIMRRQAANGVVENVTEGTYFGPVYRIAYMQNGTKQVAQFTPNGGQFSNAGGLMNEPLQNGTFITFEQLPHAVKRTFLQSGSSQVIAVTTGTTRAPVYDALVQVPGMRSQHVVVTRSGELLQPTGINEAAGANNGRMLPQYNGGNITGTVTGHMLFRDLGWSVQKPMLDITGYAHITDVQQMQLSDGRIAYRGQYIRDDQTYEVTVAKDGTVLSHNLVPGGRIR